MAEPLKNYYGLDVPKFIAEQISQVYPQFSSTAFLQNIEEEYLSLELMPRGRYLAHRLREHLPAEYEAALPILVASSKTGNEAPASMGSMAAFLYLPHVSFIAAYGLGNWEASMNAQHHFTQLFTAEFSIRPFLEKYPEQTLALLQTWTRDPSAHVRRLVSEGTRPRLPWASRLPRFQKDPALVLALLELLKDDPEEYVRRSVANNLNDIGKDHPELLLDVCSMWAEGASPPRRRLIQHALRSLVKAGHPRALAIVGYSGAVEVAVRSSSITPSAVPWQGTVVIAVELLNGGSKAAEVMLDLCLEFCKKDGRQSPQVFKWKTLTLGAGESILLRKSFSLQERTTRKHYAGTHGVQVQVNGIKTRIGSFELLPDG